MVDTATLLPLPESFRSEDSHPAHPAAGTAIAGAESRPASRTRLPQSYETRLRCADGTLRDVVFQNLIGNAVKYRRPGRPPVVCISVTPDRHGPDQQGNTPGWRIDIRDNGIGIAVEDRKRVFGIFQRLHRRDEYEGTGVGLAICKKIVEHHGGRLWVDDPPDDDLRGEDGTPCGSLFRLVLPALDDASRQNWAGRDGAGRSGAAEGGAGEVRSRS